MKKSVMFKSRHVGSMMKSYLADRVDSISELEKELHVGKIVS